MLAAAREPHLPVRVLPERAGRRPTVLERPPSEFAGLEFWLPALQDRVSCLCYCIPSLPFFLSPSPFVFFFVFCSFSFFPFSFSSPFLFFFLFLSFFFYFFFSFCVSFPTFCFFIRQPSLLTPHLSSRPPPSPHSSPCAPPLFSLLTSPSLLIAPSTSLSATSPAPSISLDHSMHFAFFVASTPTNFVE